MSVTSEQQVRSVPSRSLWWWYIGQDCYRYRKQGKKGCQSQISTSLWTCRREKNITKSSFFLFSSRKLMNIAFVDMNPFPMRQIQNRRSFHLEKVRLELTELEAIRQTFIRDRETNQDGRSFVSDDEEDNWPQVHRHSKESDWSTQTNRSSPPQQWWCAVKGFCVRKCWIWSPNRSWNNQQFIRFVWNRSRRPKHHWPNGLFISIPAIFLCIHFICKLVCVCVWMDTLSMALHPFVSSYTLTVRISIFKNIAVII